MAPNGFSLQAVSENDEEDVTSLIYDAVSAAGDVAYVWDLESDRLVWYGDVEGLIGANRSESLTSGEAFHERINLEDVSKRLQMLSAHLQSQKPFDCEFRIRHNNGEFIWVHDKGSAELDQTGAPVRFFGVIRLIANRKAQEHLLEHKATYDELTGHFNRSRLREQMQSVIAYNKRFNVTGGYLAIGIDKLSSVNDAFGHETADALIMAVSQRIESCLRVTDQIGRLGGDRFGVILPKSSERGMEAVAEKILETIRETPIETHEGPIHVTVSIGGVSIPGYAEASQEALTAAESALQDAKSRGRNCYVAFELSEDQRRVHRENRELGEQVLTALVEGRIFFAYQPVVETATRNIAYYETLLRMRRPDGEVVNAGVFVPVAEKLGFMRQLDRKALEIAIEDLIKYPNITLALNISSLTVTDSSWLRYLIALIRGRPDVASRLIVEITETAALEDFDVSARFVVALRGLGCRVALDDFGSGYTSFRHMKALTVDVVKIDGAFVKDVSRNNDNQLFVRTLLGLANGFGLSSVAECVETAEEVAILEKEGADYLQGWYFGKPEINPSWRKK